MDALLFVVIMIAGLGVAALVTGRAQRTPSPDDPTRPPPEETGDASEPSRGPGDGNRGDTP